MISRDEILTIIQKQFKEIVVNWDEAKFDPNYSIREMGADSLDSVLIIFHSLKELGIKLLQSDQLNNQQTINEVIEKIQLSVHSNEHKMDPE
jgi:acyl carrier protein